MKKGTAMPCTCTSIGFRHKHVNPKTGKRKITFSRTEALYPVQEQPMSLGVCMHCKLRHSRDWGLRVALESKLYDHNSFLTLTYSPEHLPKHSFLDYDAPVLFIKRLREQYGPNIRTFGCAEYGEKFSRPHYHICLLNFDFPDKKIYGNSHANIGINKRENTIFTSAKLEDLWPYGNARIGSLTLESASYVARYCTKKITGKLAEKTYEVFNPSTGEVLQRPPERTVSVSRNRGLGYPWYEKYGEYVRRMDNVPFEGKNFPPPKFFDKLTEEIDPDRFEEIKEKRRVQGAQSADKIELEYNLDPQRLYTLERVQLLKFQQLKRTIENG